jgi:hypothetical protein
MAITIGGCAAAHPTAQPLAHTFSVCDAWKHPTTGKEPGLARLSGVALSTAEGNYLEDPACGEGMVRIRLPLSIREPNSNASILADALNPMAPPSSKRGRVHCSCVGQLVYTDGLPVLTIVKVERVWFD